MFDAALAGFLIRVHDRPDRRARDAQEHGFPGLYWNTLEDARPWVQALLAEAGETLAAHDGTAGILRDQAPPSLDGRDHADAFVVSTENTLT